MIKPHNPTWLIATALALAACSKTGGTGGATASATPAPHTQAAAAKDACGVLSAAEIEAATGVKPGPGQARSASADSDASACEWLHADTANFGKSPLLELSIVRPDKVDSVEQVYKDAFKGAPVPGVGAQAYWLDAGNALFARSGAKAVVAQVMDGKDRQSAASWIASLALGRL